MIISLFLILFLFCTEGRWSKLIECCVKCVTMQCFTISSNKIIIRDLIMIITNAGLHFKQYNSAIVCT